MLCIVLEIDAIHSLFDTHVKSKHNNDACMHSVAANQGNIDKNKCVRNAYSKDEVNIGLTWQKSIDFAYGTKTK